MACEPYATPRATCRSKFAAEREVDRNEPARRLKRADHLLRLLPARCVLVFVESTFPDRFPFVPRLDCKRTEGAMLVIERSRQKVKAIYANYPARASHSHNV